MRGRPRHCNARNLSLKAGPGFVLPCNPMPSNARRCRVLPSKARNLFNHSTALLCSPPRGRVRPHSALQGTETFSLAARHRNARHCSTRYCSAQHCPAWPGKARTLFTHGAAWWSTAWPSNARLGEAMTGEARKLSITAPLGRVWPCPAMPGRAMRGTEPFTHGPAWHFLAALCLARQSPTMHGNFHSQHGKVARGGALRGTARRGEARKLFNHGHCEAWPGTARRGGARHGTALQSGARQGTDTFSWHQY